MNIKWLEYLTKAVQYNTLTEAAEKLYISQPALTKAIASLEKEYGITILTRSYKGIELTPEGKEFLYYAVKVVNASNMLEQTYLHGEEKPASRIFVAAMQLDFMGEIMLELYGKNWDKNLHYCLESGNRSAITKKILNNAISMGIIVENDADGHTLPWKQNAEELDIMVLDHSPMKIALGPRSIFYHEEYVTLEQAEKAPSIALDMGEHASRELNIDNRLDAINHRKVIFTDSIEICRTFLQNTEAVMFISSWAEGFFRNTPIKVLPVKVPKERDEELPENRLLLIKKKNLKLTDSEVMFTRLLADHFHTALPEDFR